MSSGAKETAPPPLLLRFAYPARSAACRGVLLRQTSTTPQWLDPAPTPALNFIDGKGVAEQTRPARRHQ
jgi:hypothetical protein